MKRFSEWIAFISGVLVAVLAMMLFPVQPAHADRLDQLETMDASSYCQQKTMLFADGMTARNTGAARAVKQATEDMVRRSKAGESVELPKDAMYAEQLDQLNDREKAFLQATLFEGWDAVNAIIGKTLQKFQAEQKEGYALNVIIAPDAIERMAQTYFENCSRQRAEQSTFKHTAFVRTASSESLANTNHAMELQCQAATELAQWVWSMKAHGLSEAAFWANFPLPENWSEGAKTAARKMVDEAYRWPRGEFDFVQYIHDECVAGR